ncbi:MAG: SDR family oxidoreductase [Hyphomonadaceae bacterium]|nr:SDR family oxidoreductase [Hyphomonadaceae bacterium]
MVGTLNPVTLVAGAASAIGMACASRIAPAATGGLILIDRDAERLDMAADSLPQAPERVSTLPFDLADQTWWRKGSEFIEAQYGRLDWAIVNAGIAAQGDPHWRAVTSIDIEAAVLSLRAIIALMKRNREGGAIVLTGGFSASRPRGDRAGLLHVLHVAAKEGARCGVRVNAVAPSADAATVSGAPVFEDLVRQLGNPSAAFERLAQSKAPVARFGGDDVPELVANLLTDSGRLTGSLLVADGGYTL